MENEVFNLSMTDFNQTASHTLKRLKLDSDFLDVTLCSEDGKSIKAHKVVLSSFSPVFQNILKNNPHPHPLLFLSSVTVTELANILTFIYLGEAQIPVGEFDRFIEVAKRFKINGIAEYDTDNKENIENSRRSSSRRNKTSEGTDYQIRKIEAVEEETSISSLDLSKEILDENTIPRSDLSKIQYEEGPAKGKFKCEECDYAATQSGSLKVHVESKHRGVRYPCQMCSYKGTTKGNTKAHMKAKHTI